VSGLAESLGLEPTLLWRLVGTGSTILAYVALQLLLRRLVNVHVKMASRRYTLRKTINYTLGFGALATLVLIWTSGGGTGLAAYLGIVSAGLAIALADPLTNVAGWLFLLVRKPFGVGDRVQVGSHAGDVIDLRLFQFSMVEIGNWVQADQSTGRVIHLPNGWVFKHPIANYTQDFNFIWDEIPVTLTFESDWRRAKDILGRIAEEHSSIPSEQAQDEVRRAARKYHILYQHLTPIVWTSVADNGVTLTLRYLCAPRARRSTETKMWEGILTAFDAEKTIDFAYPTTRFYDNVREGKPGAGGLRSAGQPGEEGRS